MLLANFICLIAFFLSLSAAAVYWFSSYVRVMVVLFRVVEDFYLYRFLKFMKIALVFNFHFFFGMRKTFGLNKSDTEKLPLFYWIYMAVADWVSVLGLWL